MSDGLSILVTGGAGYLGSILVPELLSAGHRVTVLDSFMYRQNSLAHVCYDGNLDIVRGDARDRAVVEPLVAAADAVIPMAALVGAPLCASDTIGAVTTNRDAVAMVCDLLSKDQWLLVPTTNSGYGIGSEEGLCTEETPLRPVSLYGRTKVEAEAAVLERTNSVSFRLATVFGMAPRMRLDLLVNDFVFRAVTERTVTLFEGHFRRNFIHIRDVARAFLHGLKNFDALKGAPYNVGLSDANLSKEQLCKLIQKQVPEFTFVSAPIGEDLDKRDYIVSNEKIEATGFRPKFSLDEGVKELRKGYAMLRNTVYGNV